MKKLELKFRFYLSIFPLVFLISLFFYELTGNKNTVLVGFCFCFIYTLISAIRYSGILSFYSIYLYTSAFFLYDCFFLSLFSDKDFLEQSFPKVYSFDEKIGIIFLVCSFITLYVTHLVYLYTRKKKFLIIRDREFKKNENLFKIGLILFCLFLIPVLYKIFLQVSFIMQNGYISIYTGALSEIKYPFWTAGVFIFFNAGFYILMASKPKEKEFIILSVIYFCVYFFDSLKGGRGTVLAVLLVLLVYYSKVYKHKIKFRKLLYAGLFIIAFTIILGNVRNSYGNENKSSTDSSLNVGELVSNALWSQTNTRAVPMLIIQGDLKYHDYPFIFWPITNLIVPHFYPVQHGATELSLEKFNNPSLVLIANVSKEAGLAGFGYDSAFLGEAYEIGGYLGIILFSLLLGIILCFFDFTDLNFRYISVPFLFDVLLTIPRLPRKPILSFICDMNILLTVYFIIIFFSVFINTLKKRNEL